MKTLITKTKKFLLSIPDKLKPFYFDKQELQYKKINGWLMIIIFCMSLIFFYIGWNISEKNSIELVEKYKEEEKSIILKNGDKFSEEKLILFLNELNIKFPEIIYSQAKLESANFSSKIFFENSNLFGMKEANKRPNIQSGEQNNHAYYINWRNSVIDYCIFYSCYLRNLKTKEQYYDYIEKNYSETIGYSDRVKSIEKEYFKKIKGLTGNSYDTVAK